MVLEMLHVGSGRSAGVHDLDQLLETTNERIPTKLRHLCRAIGGHVPCLSIRIDNGPRDSVSVLRECSGWHFDVYRPDLKTCDAGNTASRAPVFFWSSVFFPQCFFYFFFFTITCRTDAHASTRFI